MTKTTTRKYRSTFEADVANALPKEFIYEQERFPYVVERAYVPDFCKEDLWIEVKGFFRAGDVAKYKAIRKDYPDKRLIFVFSNPKKKVRKGAKMTMAQWAEKNGWEWTTLKDIENNLWR